MGQSTVAITIISVAAGIAMLLAVVLGPVVGICYGICIGNTVIDSSVPSSRQASAPADTAFRSDTADGNFCPLAQCATAMRHRTPSAWMIRCIHFPATMGERRRWRHSVVVSCGIETSLPSSVFRYTFLGDSAEHHPQDRPVPDDSRKCALAKSRCV
jgi:hypothetical protein